MDSLKSATVLPFTKIFADHGLVQPISVQKEMSNVDRRFRGNETVLNKELDTLHSKSI